MYVFSVEHPIGLMMVVTIGDLISFIARKINLLMKTHRNISGKFKCWGNISAQQGTNCSWWAYLIGFPLSYTSTCILYFVRLNLKTLNCIQFQIHLVQDIFNWSYFVPIRLINYEWICILLILNTPHIVYILEDVEQNISMSTISTRYMLCFTLDFIHARHNCSTSNKIINDIDVYWFSKFTTLVHFSWCFT